MKISAVVLAKNEDELLAQALRSLSFCNEIIVVANDATNKTLEIAQKYATKVIKESANDFSKLRNKGLEFTKEDWIFYVDADEQVSGELVKEISSADLSDDVYKIARQDFYFGQILWPTKEYHLRLFKKTALRKWEGKLHESPVTVGTIGMLTAPLLHYTHRNLEQMLAKTIEWSDTEAMLRFNANHPKMTWWRFPRVMVTAFWRSYFSQKGYKAGTAGLIESMYQAFSMFITYAKLWELQNRK